MLCAEEGDEEANSLSSHCLQVVYCVIFRDWQGPLESQGQRAGKA